MQRFFLILLPLIAGLLIGTAPPRAGYQVQGRVTDQATGQAVAGARVLLLDALTQDTLAALYTGSDGRYLATIETSVAAEPGAQVPQAYAVQAAFPNPPTDPGAPVHIRYVTPGNRPATPRLELFDALGREVPPLSPLAGGVYYYRLRFDDGHRTKPQALVLLRGGRVAFRLEQATPAAPARLAAAAGAALEVRCLVKKAGYRVHETTFTLTAGTPGTFDLALVADASGLITGDPVPVATTTVGTGGGLVRVQAPGTAVDGLEIEVPPGALAQSRTFSVAYAPIENHTLGEFFQPLTPLIQIRNGGGYAEAPLTLRIPVEVPPGHFAMAVFFDEQNGTIEGLPLMGLTPTQVTAWTRHFATPGAAGKAAGKTGATAHGDPGSVGNLVIISFDESRLLGRPVIDTGFRPGVDDWEFVNRGSYIAPGGHCAGQSMTAMWYYYEHRIKGASGLYQQFDDVQSSKYVLWQDNPLGYRFASVVQADLQWDAWTRQQLIPLGEPANHALGWKAFALSMLLTGEPQYVKLSRLDQSDPQKPTWVGHAIVAYRMVPSEGKLYVADPNYPGETRSISYANGQFVPYDTKQNDAQANTSGYTHVGYLAKTTMADWPAIGARWKEFQDGTIGTKAPNAFPAYELLRVVGSNREPLPDAFDTDVDSVVIELKCTACEQFLSGTDRLQVLYVYDDEGTLLAQSGSATQGRAVVKLKPGHQRLGLYATGVTKSQPAYLDFKWIEVNAPSRLLVYPDVWNQIWAPIFGYGAPGQTYTLYAVHFKTAPPDARYTWTFGDGTAPVTVVGDSAVVHTFEQVGQYDVNLVLSDAQGRELGRATSEAHLDWFHGNFQMTRFEQTAQSGILGEPYVAKLAADFVAMTGRPSGVVFDLAYWDDGEIDAYLTLFPPGGSADVYQIATNESGVSTDKPSFITFDDNHFTGRGTFISTGGLAMGWFEVSAVQNRTHIAGTVTLYGRRYREENGSLVLRDEGSVTFTFEGNHYEGQRPAGRPAF